MMMTNVYARFLDQYKGRLKTASSAWSGLALTVLLLAQGYVLMEWVFYVTKPSFLDLFSTQDKLAVLVVSAAITAGMSLAVFLLVLMVGRLANLHQRAHLLFALASLLPAVILAALTLLLVDNFTYTLFSFGISTARGVTRGLYGLLFLFLVVWAQWQVFGIAASLQHWYQRVKKPAWVWLGVALWLAFGLGVSFLFSDKGNRELAAGFSASQPASRPNILWITGDGVSAAHLSVYGYSRDTTPFLRTLAQEALVIDNAFTNAKNTVGSLTTLFTGKSPLETRVLYTPDILRGDAAYQHLPGILRTQGYLTIQYGLPYYVDAYAVNLLDGFDVVNGQSLGNSPLQAGLRKLLPEGVAYFLYEAGNRIVDRLRHIFYIKAMPNPNETLLTDAPKLEDEGRLTAFLDSLAGLEQPAFIHLHLMGTHGPRFLVKEQFFSLGKDVAKQEMWDVDFYDDSLREFDANLARIVASLEQHGVLENTLLIIGSDHAARVDQRQRVPLILRFPQQAITGKIQSNVQSMDIAPTILDYLGLPQPEWMRGQSLLAGDPPHRYIFSAGAAGDQVIENALGIWQTSPERVKPPFFQIGIVSVIDCQRWYELNLTEMRLSSGEVARHSAPCPEDGLLSASQAYSLLQAYLADHGYEITSLQQTPLESIWGRE